MAAEPEIEAAAALNAFHEAAATADERTYFGLLTEDAVFMGTDARERWTKAEFQEYARSSFERESAWIYKPLDRHIQLGAGRRVAWFDERLLNEKYGETRGSGVLVKTRTGWKIQHYVLSFAVPNESAVAVVRAIAGQ